MRRPQAVPRAPSSHFSRPRRSLRRPASSPRRTEAAQRRDLGLCACAARDAPGTQSVDFDPSPDPRIQPGLAPDRPRIPDPGSQPPMCDPRRSPDRPHRPKVGPGSAQIWGRSTREGPHIDELGVSRRPLLWGTATPMGSGDMGCGGPMSCVNSMGGGVWMNHFTRGVYCSRVAFHNALSSIHVDQGSRSWDLDLRQSRNSGAEDSQECQRGVGGGTDFRPNSRLQARVQCRAWPMYDSQYQRYYQAHPGNIRRLVCLVIFDARPATLATRCCASGKAKTLVSATLRGWGDPMVWGDAWAAAIPWAAQGPWAAATHGPQRLFRRTCRPNSQWPAGHVAWIAWVIARLGSCRFRGCKWTS